jgi:hypothetical protein
MKRKLIFVVCVYILALFACAPALGVVPLPSPTSMHGAALPTAKPLPAHAGVTWLTLGLIVVLVSANIGIVSVLVIRDARREFAAAYSEEWDNTNYWRSLPNVLARLKQKRLASPWPSHCNRWSVRRFESRLSRLVRPLLKEQTSCFVAQHLAVWAWVQSHHEAFNQFLTRQLIERALERLAFTSNRDERLILIAFLNRARNTRLASTSDTNIRQRLRRLERLHVILREHGYGVTSEFDDAERLAQTPQGEILAILPHFSATGDPHRPIGM